MPERLVAASLGEGIFASVVVRRVQDMWQTPTRHTVPPASRNMLQATSSHATRWVTGSLSVGAGLATILASAHSCGLIGDASATRRTVMDFGVHWVGVTPARDTLESLGDTVRLAAAITDQRGTALIGTSLTWTSENPQIATVDSSGVAVAQAPGSTFIVARVGEKSGRSRLVVAPRMARLEVADTTVTIGEGYSRRLLARALDARGHVAPAVPLTWVSSDTAVIVVSDSGVVTGVGAGGADITVMHAGVLATVHASVSPVPGRLLSLDGNAQAAEAGTRLATPVRVLLESRRGRPMAGVSVHFVAERGGTAEPAYATTNGEGIASTTWTLGAMPGRQRLSATCADLDSAAILIAEAEPTAANTRVTPVGYPWTGVAGSPVPLRVAVQLTDSLGRLLPGVPVTWVALDSGSVTPLEARTDSLGESHASWLLSRRAGMQRARVRVGSGRSVPVAPVLAAGIAGPPAVLLGGDGNAQKGTAGEALRRAISVELRDDSGNPVEGAQVVGSVLTGTLGDSMAITDSRGVAAFRWTLGPKAGRQQMVVRAGRLPPLTATVLAAPGSPANIEFVSPPTSGTAGKPLSRPIRLVITDVHGNRVTDRQVTLSATSGSLSPARAMPAPDGSVTVKWRLGTKRGAQVLTAEVRGTAVRARTEVKVR